MQDATRKNFCFSSFLFSVLNLNLHTLLTSSLFLNCRLLLRPSLSFSFTTFGSSVPLHLPQKKATSSQTFFFSIEGPFLQDHGSPNFTSHLFSFLSNPNKQKNKALSLMELWTILEGPNEMISFSEC